MKKINFILATFCALLISVITFGGTSTLTKAASITTSSGYCDIGVVNNQNVDYTCEAVIQDGTMIAENMFKDGTTMDNAAISTYVVNQTAINNEETATGYIQTNTCMAMQKESSLNFSTEIMTQKNLVASVKILPTNENMTAGTMDNKASSVQGVMTI